MVLLSWYIYCALYPFEHIGVKSISENPLGMHMNHFFRCHFRFRRASCTMMRFDEICYHKNLLIKGMLEPVCCKKQQKKSSWPVTGLWNRRPLKILNGKKLILDAQGNHLDSYTISLESFRSFRDLLFCKPVTSQELFFCCFLQQTGSTT